VELCVAIFFAIWDSHTKQLFVRVISRDQTFLLCERRLGRDLQ